MDAFFDSEGPAPSVTSITTQHGTTATQNSTTAGQNTYGLGKDEYKCISKAVKRAASYDELKRTVREYRDVLQSVPTGVLNNWLKVDGCEFTRFHGVVLVRKSRVVFKQSDLRKLTSDTIRFVMWLNARLKFMTEPQVRALTDASKPEIERLELLLALAE
jgi:hypothetical protein